MWELLLHLWFYVAYKAAQMFSQRITLSLYSFGDQGIAQRRIVQRFLEAQRYRIGGTLFRAFLYTRYSLTRWLSFKCKRLDWFLSTRQNNEAELYAKSCSRFWHFLEITNRILLCMGYGRITHQALTHSIVHKSS